MLCKLPIKFGQKCPRGAMVPWAGGNNPSSTGKAALGANQGAQREAAQKG